MNSIEAIFDNSNQLIDGIHHFFDRYIGNSLLRKSGIHKIVDKIMSKGSMRRWFRTLRLQTMYRPPCGLVSGIRSFCASHC